MFKGVYESTHPELAASSILRFLNNVYKTNNSNLKKNFVIVDRDVVVDVSKAPMAKRKAKSKA